jgi:3-oxoacyl-[acyl-carrier protein] reductase
LCNYTIFEFENRNKNMKLLEGKNALITGGSRGIGESIARVFAAQGAHVAFTYQSSEEKALTIEKELSALGIKAKAYKSDASDFAQAEHLINEVVASFGTIDILVNNAGITRDTLMLRMSEEQWDEVIRVNLKSVFNLTKNVLKPMLKAKSGSIINMGSVVGVFGNAGQANYAASKAGIIGFSKSIAKEVGSRGIRCNVITPGFIETDMTHALTDDQRKAYEANIPLKRLGKGDDVSNACVFLGSDMSTYITGQVLSVCGGLLD